AVDAMFIRRGYPVRGSHQINTVVEAGFSKDINEKVVMGGTVTYANLQIAYYMGFSTALLVGVDHRYGKYECKQPGSTFIAEGADDAHFHGSYFGDGRIYNAPELNGTVRMYALADKVWRAAGRRIINLTPGTALDVFEQGAFADWMA
ncbi:MAG: hypothetical protein OEZ02_15460, partial [Anaerolineae bacterium]|nr:hypothetical protein [Anaerolineae bacterium]